MRFSRLVPIVAVTLGLMANATLGAVQPLTAETLQDAIEAGQTAKKVKHLCTLYDGVRTKVTSGDGVRGFSLSIRTPYCDVAYRVFEAKRKYETFKADEIEILPPSDQVVLIVAEPSTNLGKAFSFGGTTASSFSDVVKVVLRRGSEIVQPVTSEFHDVTFSNAYGKEEVYQGGTFSFPLSAFDSSLGPLEIVIVPSSTSQGDEAVKEMEVKDLEKLQ